VNDVAAAPRVVPLRDDQEEACGAMLARAFFDDPIFRWVEPDDALRARFLSPFFTGLTRRSHRLAVALATEDVLEGASLWKTPGLTTLSPAELAMTGLDRISEWLSDEARARLDAVFDPVEAAFAEDLSEPVWYLGVLGVEPGLQGRGIGSRLMAPILERADREARSVTLETAQPKNLPLYRRHGFRVLRELPAPLGDGPMVWTMKREPRSGLPAGARAGEV
jgi:GNAT superfamily N-acetyltransferase